MALPADFSKIYGSTATGGLTPISDVNYAKGWEFVGSIPPTKNDFSYLQNLSDRKSQWLYSNKLQRTDPFGDIKSDGAAAVSTALANLGLGTAVTKNVGTGNGQIPDMSAWASGQGWRRTPDGYIEQWGVLQQNSNVTQKLTFPIPFTTVVENICLTETTQSPSVSNISVWSFNLDSLTLTDVTVMCSKTNTGEYLYWRALGK